MQQTRIAFLFSGQGAQYPGMFRDLYEAEPSVRSVFDGADEALGRPISQLCFLGGEEELNLTHNTQPCVLAADLAAGLLLQEKGVHPDAAAGFSLGEYAALSFAGAIAMKDVFPMVQLRSDAMQEAVPCGKGAMAALIGRGAAQAGELCAEVRSGYVVPANYTCPVQTVISGESAAVDEAIHLAEQRSIACMKLPVSGPFHCELMRPAAERLTEVFRRTAFLTPNLPVYMNVDGRIVSDGSRIPELLVRQVVSPVQWVSTLQNMWQDGISTFIECGPGRTLSGFVKKTLRDARVYRVENQKTLQSTLEALDLR